MPGPESTTRRRASWGVALHGSLGVGTAVAVKSMILDKRIVPNGEGAADRGRGS